MRIFFYKRIGRFSLLSFFIIPVLLIAACVSSSVYTVSRACRDMDSLLENGIIPSEDFLSGGMNPRTLSLFLENYSDTQLLAAGYLLQNRRELDKAVFLLDQIPLSSSPLSAMAGDLLLECLREREEWGRIAACSSERLSLETDGRYADSLISSLTEAVWKGHLDSGEYSGFYENSLSGWSVPLRAEKGILDYTDYIRFLLTEDPVLIDEIIQNRPGLFPGREDPADPTHRILTTRSLIKEVRYGDAEALIRDLWDDFSSLSSLPSAFLEDFKRVITGSGEEDYWIPVIEEWKKGQPDDFSRSFLLAALCEGDRQWKRAFDLYNTAAESGLSFQRRRAQWYQLRLLIRQDPENVPDFLFQNAESWGNTDYFDDLMDEYYSLLVRSRSWRGLKDTLKALEGASLSGPVVQGQFLLNEAAVLGLTELPGDIFTAGESSEMSNDYYALLQDASSWPVGSSVTGLTADIGLSPREAAVAEVYRILHQAGYPELCLSLWNHRKDVLDFDTVEGLCVYLFKQKEFYSLIQFSGYWYYRWPRPLALNLLPWLYPTDNGLPVNLLSREYELPEELIEGIIRRESAFNKTIESFAGAQGLMQIMPATASDLASRHRIPEWDLMNPDDNIRLGSLYLNWLIERPWTDNYADVLAAYNGGGGNLRQWKRRYGSLGNQLFIQSIPYSETRNYIRKVIVAAGAYRYLNTGAAPGEWVSLFFAPFPAM